jgi:hypothetical protein
MRSISNSRGAPRSLGALPLAAPGWILADGVGWSWHQNQPATNLRCLLNWGQVAKPRWSGLDSTTQKRAANLWLRPLFKFTLSHDDRSRCHRPPGSIGGIRPLRLKGEVRSTCSPRRPPRTEPISGDRSQSPGTRPRVAESEEHIGIFEFGGGDKPDRGRVGRERLDDGMRIKVWIALEALALGDKGSTDFSGNELHRNCPE